MDIFERNNIDIKKIAVVESEKYRYKLRSSFDEFVALMKNICFSWYFCGSSISNEKILFLNGISSIRSNETQAYSKIRSCAEYYDEIHITKKMRLANIPYNLYLACKYNFRLLKKKIPRAERWIYLSSMIHIRRFLIYLEKQDLAQYRIGIVYNDLNQLDNAFVQYLKNIDVTTATCQHGIFTASKPNGGLYFSGLELQHSIADIFLAWNPMTYDEAVLSGMEPSKIRILGISKCIGIKRDAEQGRKNAFGVILNHASMYNYNIQLLQAANYVAENNDMKYYVKFHPSLDLSAYDDYLDERYALKLPIKTSVTEYSNLVDFSILSHSTVYVELLFLKSKVYLLHVDNLCKFTHFSEYDFSSKEELDKLIHKDYDVDKMFNYYCFTDNPEQEYKRFFREIEKQPH